MAERPVKLRGVEGDVLAALRRFTHNGGHTCAVRMGELAKEAGHAPRGCTAALIILEAHGLIEVERSARHATNRYTVTPKGADLILPLEAHP